MSVVAKAVKSRSGCRTCKLRRVKCNETRPSCKQCDSKNLQCPGYATRWKWSTKHEKHSSLPVLKGRPSTNEPPTLEDLSDAVETVDPRVRPPRETAARDMIEDLLQVAPGSDSQAIPASSQIEIVTEEQSLHPSGFGGFSTSWPSSSPSFRSFQAVALWQPPDTVLSNPQVQVEFFTERICKVLTAFDSDYNQFRTVARLRTKESLLYFSLCRYITAAFLNSSAFHTGNALVVQKAQTDILYRLQNEVAQLDISKHTKIQEVLMAVIMFGLATNWDGSNSPSILHYNAAVRMYRHTYQPGAANVPHNEYREFFLGCLVYWWMGLAFVTDTLEHCLLSPPISEPAAIHGYHSGQSPRRTPHPLAGASVEGQRLLGQVGLLVFEQRSRCREKHFTSMSRLQKEYQALQEAKRLEDEALSLDRPKAEEFVDIGDPDTPIQDLINTAEAYRLSALVLLYRAFPDLLNVRLGLDEDAANGHESTEAIRSSWVTALAIHTLEILCRNTPHSGTRSIEQILLVIIAGELRQPSSNPIIQVHSECDTSDLVSFLAGTSPPTSFTTNFWDQFAAICSFPDQDSIPAVLHSSSIDASRLDRVKEARATVFRRLQSLRKILPYKSLEIVEELVLTTWRTSDHGKPDVFWMDIMIEKEWKFLLV